MNRTNLMKAFIAKTEYADWDFNPLTADASFRSYQRGTNGTGTVILMDAPPENGEDIRPFLKVTNHLGDMGLSPPRIHASDPEAGFIIMQDFGDNLVANHCAAHPEDEDQIYNAAINVLAHGCQFSAPADLPEYDRPTYHREANLVLDWYCDPLSDETKSDFAAALDATLDQLSSQPKVLVQRDYHAENLIWRPQEQGRAKLGLLDYQDALQGHPAYDLVSLLEDARRKLSGGLKGQMIANAAERMQIGQVVLEQDMAILGAQRNLKIIGIFARLWLRDGKPKYPTMIPHVHKLLMGNLDHPSTTQLAHWCQTNLPKPTDARLSEMMERR